MRCEYSRPYVWGSAQIAETMAALIESGGGAVLCSARVEGVVVEPDTGQGGDASFLSVFDPCA